MSEGLRPRAGLHRASQPAPGVPGVPGVSGGAEGNERLTAMTGAVLLVLLAAEGVTILSLGQLLTPHFFIGMLLLDPVTLKAGSTIYRFARYYTGSAPYRRKGPPALLLRLLGPVIIASTAGVFGTGIALAVSGPAGRQPWLFLHKASFVLWLGATGLHVLGRLIPATRLTVNHGAGRLPGRALRAGVLALMLGVAVLSGVLATGLAAHWQGPAGPDDGPRHFIKYER